MPFALCFFFHQRVRAEDDSPHLHLPAFSSAVASASGSDDAGSPDDTVIESISDDGMGVENGGSSSSSSSSSILRLSVATDVACSGVGDGVGGDIVPLAVLPPPSIEEQVSLVRVVLENSDEIKPGQTRFLVAKRCVLSIDFRGPRCRLLGPLV